MTPVPTYLSDGLRRVPRFNIDLKGLDPHVFILGTISSNERRCWQHSITSGVEVCFPILKSRETAACSGLSIGILIYNRLGSTR